MHPTASEQEVARRHVQRVFCCPAVTNPGAASCPKLPHMGRWTGTFSRLRVSGPINLHQNHHGARLVRAGPSCPIKDQNSDPCHLLGVHRHKQARIQKRAIKRRQLEGQKVLERVASSTRNQGREGLQQEQLQLVPPTQPRRQRWPSIPARHTDMRISPIITKNVAAQHRNICGLFYVHRSLAVNGRSLRPSNGAYDDSDTRVGSSVHPPAPTEPQRGAEVLRTSEQDTGAPLA